jgi:hypothetical protein
MLRIAEVMDQQEKIDIATAPWPEFADKPQVAFNIAHNGDHILIRYDVTEREVLARFEQINEPVYRDSCVEFFIALEEGGPYYNFEFNSLGTCLCGFGPQREGRILLPTEVLEKIRYERSLKSLNDNGEAVFNWTLTLAVPVEVFCYHDLSSLSGLKCTMNFYKCGDDLARPHYLVWNLVKTDNPDYHRPEFFGRVEFM